MESLKPKNVQTRGVGYQPCLHDRHLRGVCAAEDSDVVDDPPVNSKRPFFLHSAGRPGMDTAASGCACASRSLLPSREVRPNSPVRFHGKSTLLPEWLCLWIEC